MIPALLDWAALSPDARRQALARPAASQAPQIAAEAAAIIGEVRAGGDAALRALTLKLDRVALEGPIAVPARADPAPDPADLAAIARAAGNLRRFHAAQAVGELRLETEPGVLCRRITRPIDPVGLYIPGGSAPLFSTLLMLAIPARLAGCASIVLCTPPDRSGRIPPAIAAAAEICGLTEIHRLGGAQAIAAMAYGTESVPRCAKIFGPGNAWVTAAKSQVAADPEGAQIDMPAGPSEVLVIADAAADPAITAADLLAQAEHDPASQVVLVTPSGTLAEAVRQALEAQLRLLPRQAIAAAAIAHARILLTRDLQEAVDVSNAYAPEHLILSVADPEALLPAISNAGSIFLGPFAAESFGDYSSGTNHVLPTYGFARALSGVSLGSFQKQITVQSLTADGLRSLGPDTARLARLEGLEAHARAVTLRLERLP